MINTVDHYENFPVASALIPPRMRPAIASIYWFARSADDIADEGHALASARLAALGVYRKQLAIIESGAAPEHPRFKELAKQIHQHNLPTQYFADLLTAFEQDCTKKTYQNWHELKFYCEHSANPVGRIMLSLFGLLNEKTVTASDQICTGLQLTNFLQDIRHDWLIGRLYIPLDELAAHSLNQEAIAIASKNRVAGPDLLQVLQLQHERAALLLQQGESLLPMLPGRLGLEIAATVAGGQRILHRLARQQFAGFAARPVLKASDWIIILAKALASRLR